MFIAYGGARGGGRLHFLTRRYGCQRIILEAVRMKVKYPFWKEIDEIIERYVDWLRMLTPRELHNAQGFPPDYEIEVDCYGNTFTKSEQTERCGNSVPPAFATALVRANWPEACHGIEITTMEQFHDAVAV